MSINSERINSEAIYYMVKKSYNEFWRKRGEIPPQVPKGTVTRGFAGWAKRALEGETVTMSIEEWNAHKT